MISSDLLIAVCLGYAALLFAVAYFGDLRARQGRLGWLRSPLVYTLSISVYCTGWTFYGAVGSAARSGLEFIAIYTGPTLVFIGWWWILRKLVRIARRQRITSIADLISSRYGKSNGLAIAVTLLAVCASTPYIALQLQSLTLSFQVFSDDQSLSSGVVGFWIAAVLAVFTILFGTRNVDVNERHHGVVTAIALEAVVKLIALVAVGLFVVFSIGGGVGAVFEQASPTLFDPETIFGSRWVTLTFLSATAVICLPRMFQVAVVENVDERHLVTASWAFPAYLLLICLFVLPIAITGASVLPDGSNPDMYVLTLPLYADQQELALLVLIGGFSSATSMVIVATIALSTMISNHIIMPLWLFMTREGVQTSGDVRAMLLTSRRFSIGFLLFLGYLYFRLTGGSAALASIGLIAFAGAAQVLPGLLAGIFWRGATRAGALAGLIAGATVWVYTLFLPSFEGEFILTARTLVEGPFGIQALRPEALFGLSGLDPLVHAIFWSMTFNVGALIGVSLMSMPSPLERLQSALFVDVFRLEPNTAPAYFSRSATSEDLFTLAQRILGNEKAYHLFLDLARAQGSARGLPRPTSDVIARLERELAGIVGAASAHAMVSQIAGGDTISMDALISIADETAQIVEYSNQLELKSRELQDTAAELRRANVRLEALGTQKDEFLSQVSHELRTPMTSIRSFSEILLSSPDLSRADAEKFLGIINVESIRLTRLLDEILDISVLENRKINWKQEPVRIEDALDQAIAATEGLTSKVEIIRGDMGDAEVLAVQDRLAQVFINLISNVVKYASVERPRLEISLDRNGDTYVIDLRDNGPGVAVEDQDRIFEKFARASTETDNKGAGLGLPISREIMRNLSGDLTLVRARHGAIFRVTLPVLGAAADQFAAK